MGETPARDQVCEARVEASRINSEGIRHSVIGELEHAFLCFDRAGAMDPEYAEAHCNLGNVAWQWGDDDSARDAFSACIDLRPQFAYARLARARVLRALREYDAALADLEVFIDLNGGEEFDLGCSLASELSELEVLRFLHEPDPAGASLPARAAECLQPAAGAGMNTAIEALHSGNLGAALGAFDALIRATPSQPLLLANRATVLLGLGETARAAADCDDAIRLDPSLSLGYANRGAVLRALGDTEGAESDFTRAIELGLATPPVYGQRGMNRFEIGDLDGAHADFESALEEDEDTATALYGRGLVRNARHDLTGAVDDFSLALASEPGFADAYCARALAHAAQGAYREAIADLEGYIHMGGTQEMTLEDARSSVQKLRMLSVSAVDPALEIGAAAAGA
jgi:tetratricopeptide (TPR) repeat protein